MLCCKDGALSVDVLLIHKVDQCFILVGSLEVISQLVVVHDELGQKLKAFHIELKRAYQSSEAVFSIKVKDKVFIFFLEDFFQLLGLVRLDSVLAISWHLFLISSGRLSILAHRLRNVTLHGIQKEVDVLFAFK